MINFILVSDEHRECANWRLFKDYHRKNIKDAIDHFSELNLTGTTPYLIHLGDMVHSHKPPTSVDDPRGIRTLQELYEDFVSVQDKVTPIFINGNHDNRHGLYKGLTVPEYLQNFITLPKNIEHDTTLNLFKVYAPDQTLLAVAYGYPVEGKLRNLAEEYSMNLMKSFTGQAPKILFTHIPANGVTVGNYELNTAFTIPSMKWYSSDIAVFSGDIHKAQKYGEVSYVGSPYDTRSRETIEDIVDFSDATEDILKKYKDTLPSFTMVSYDEGTGKVSRIQHPAKYVCLDVIGKMDIDTVMTSTSDLEHYLVEHNFTGPISTLKLKAKINIRMNAQNKEIFYSKGDAIDVTSKILSQHPNILEADTSVTFGTFVNGVFIPESDETFAASTQEATQTADIVHNHHVQFYEYKNSITRKFSQEDWRNVEKELGVKES